MPAIGWDHPALRDRGSVDNLQNGLALVVASRPDAAHDRRILTTWVLFPMRRA
jgi:hypothetical protein